MQRRNRAALAAGLLCFVWTTPGARAQGSDPVGSEFQVNAHTTGGQGVPAVAFTATGELVAVWQSATSPGGDDDSFSIQGRRFDTAGQPVGAELQVNTFTTHSQFQPDLAVGAGGEMLVVWASGDSLSGAGPDGDLEGISGQLFDAAGAPVGGEMVINSYTTSSQRSPRVAALPTGGFVLVWASSNASVGDDFSSWSIQGRRLDADGLPVGEEIQVNQGIVSAQRSPDVAVGDDGSFVVVWESFTTSPGDDDSYWSIIARSFSASGDPRTGDFQVNTYTTGSQRYPSIAFGADEHFLVAWQSAGSGGDDTSNDSIQAQRLALDGTSVGAEFQVNAYTPDPQRYPRIAAEPGGRFLVVWDSGRDGLDGGDGDAAAIRGIQLDAAGSPLGDDLVINTTATGSQLRPVAASGSVGRFVVAWGSESSAGSDSDYSTQAQLFADPAVLFVDGFESGDTSVWTTTTP